MKRMINSNPLKFEGLMHNQKVQQPAAQLHSIRTGHEFVQQTVAQIYKTSHHNYFVQAPLAQLPSSPNKKRPPLTMEPSIDDPLAAVTHRIYNSFVSGNTNSKRHTRAGGYPALPHNYFWMPACASMTERRGGMLR
jgi:hypothetical protein